MRRMKLFIYLRKLVSIGD